MSVDIAIPPPAWEIARVSDGHVADLAARTDVVSGLALVLVLGRQEYAKARLRETSPDVLHQVAFYQHACRILKLEMILDDEGIARDPTHKIRVTRCPLQRLKEVITADHNIGRSGGRSSASEQDALARGFQEIVLNLVRAGQKISGAAEDCVGISTGASPRSAVEVVEIGSMTAA